jgi:D-alanyl-D-alanine carboxypeptidase
MEPAVTGDAGRRLTVSIFTNTFDPDLALPRFTALTNLIDHALCR